MNTIYEIATERVSGSVLAASAVTSNFWLPGLKDFSATAGEWLPILGVVWLLVQIVGYGIDFYKKYKDDDK